ncbi:hypothetical protein DXT68_11280 [Microbacterium foliorum]|nr:hypothetical protein DXT68_11280 [Microbacterium foliorum]
MRAYRASVIAASKRGPLQSLTDRELALKDCAVTIYPKNLQRRVQAWVRFGGEAIRVEAKLMRSTPHAAGIEFSAEGQVWRCWVWGNAVQVPDDH